MVIVINTLMFLLNALAFAVVLGLIVAIHELGHLIFAKRAKILCYEYSIGMGPAVYTKEFEETKFSIRAIPIGGFVSMAGEELSKEMIAKDDEVGLILEDGKVKEIILSDKIESEMKMKITNFEIYDEEQTGYLFVEGLVEGDIEHFEILEEAVYVVSEKQQLQIAPYKRCFESKTYLEKFLTLIAGPGMNFLLALFLFFIVASFTGKPQNINKIGSTIDYLPASIAGLNEGDEIISIGGVDVKDWNSIGSAVKGLTGYEGVEVVVKIKKTGVTETFLMDLAIDINQLGISNYNKDGIVTSDFGAIVGNSYGHGANVLQAGDIITKVKYLDNDEVIINNWYDLINVVNSVDGKELTVTFNRDGETFTKELHAWELKVLNSQGVSQYSVSLGITPLRKFSFGYSLITPFKSTWESFTQVISVIGLLFGGSKQIGVGDLSGPIGIFNLIGQIMRQGVLALLSFTAFLSVNIGVLNLLPIPALDGGRILFISIEGVTRKKIPRKVENMVNNIFFILLMLLFVYVAINDVIRVI